MGVNTPLFYHHKWAVLIAKLIPELHVIDCQNDSLFRATRFNPFFDSVWFVTGAYLRDVWSKFIIKESAMEWNNVPQDQRFDVEILASLLFLPILEYPALFVNPNPNPYEVSKLIHFKCSFWLHTMKASAVATTTTVLTTPPFLLSTCRKFHVFIQFARSPLFELWNTC